ncbi:MAG: LysM peptidoglycan-binding domain-containing protein, partial [Gammaproteobacteria bacterium]|nr:LysM peptidoglycan-binding domain-containing protein [Gammaproteobacteria bacterium]
WGQLAPQLSGGVFTRSLTLASGSRSGSGKHEKIHLYAEFEKLQHIRMAGFLRPYIEYLQQQENKYDPDEASQSGATFRSATEKNSPANITKEDPAEIMATSDPVHDKTITTKPDSRLNSSKIVALDVSKKTITSITSNTKASPKIPAHRKPGNGPYDSFDRKTDRRQTKNIDTSGPARQAGNSKSGPKSGQAREAMALSSSNLTRPVAARTELPHNSNRALQTGEASETLADNKTAPSIDHDYPLNSYLEHTTNDSQADEKITETKSSLWLWSLISLLLVIAISSMTYYFLWPDEKEHKQIQTHAIPVSPLSLPQVEQPESFNNLINQKNSRLEAEAVDSLNIVVKPDDTVLTGSNRMFREQKTSQEQNDQYHARIENNKGELTIVLTTPEDENAFNETVNNSVQNPTATNLSSKDLITDSPDKISITIDKNTTDKNEPGYAENSRSSEIVHLVVKGDTLWHITKRYIHNPYRYPELARINKIANPDLIYPGQKVRIIQIFSKKQPTK